MTEEGGREKRAFQCEAEHEQRRNAFRRKETSNMEASIRIAAASSMGPELEEECQGSSLCSARGNFIPAAGWGVEVGNRFNQVYQNIMYH